MTSAALPEEISAFFEKAFGATGKTIPDIVSMDKDHVLIRLDVEEAHLRPGGYISGPTQMQMADHVAYLAVFTQLGIVPMAVTSNLNINFLRPCIGESVEAHARILKLGRTLAVIEVDIKAGGSDKLSSHAIVTYSIPADAAKS